MKNKLFTVVFLCFVMGISGCGKEENVPTTPSLEFSIRDIDIGVVSNLGHMSVTYPVKNISASQTVVIKSISTGCGCTSVTDPPKELKPGDEGVFDFQFDPGWRQGAYSRTVKITTDDPAQDVYEVAFHGEIYSPLRWEPREAVFGEIPGGQEHRKRVNLIIEDVEDPKIESASPVQDERVKYELIEVVDHESEGHRGVKYVFDVVIEKDFPVGKFVTKTRLNTDSGQSLPNLTVHGEVMSDVVFEPKRAFCRLKPGETRDEILTLVSATETPFTVTKIDDGGVVPVTITVEEGDEAYEKVLRFRFAAPNAVDGKMGKARITVETEAALEPIMLEIPLMMVVRPK